MSDNSSLFAAIRYGDLGAVQSLLNVDSALASARNGSGVSAILMAVYSGRAEIKDLLLARGAQLELPDAAALGDLAGVQEFIRKDSAQVKSCSPDGFPVVALAAVFGHIEIVRFLASNGADINAVASNGTGYNALTGAVAGGHTAIVKWLLENGANPNYRYAAGYSPLLTAAANGHLKIIGLLLDRGAELNAITNDGKSALALAAERNHPDAVALLQARSAA
jgi:uncharacterized protein